MTYIRCPASDGALRQVVAELNLALQELEQRLQALEQKKGGA